MKKKIQKILSKNKDIIKIGIVLVIAIVFILWIQKQVNGYIDTQANIQAQQCNVDNIPAQYVCTSGFIICDTWTYVPAHIEKWGEC